MKRIIFWVCLLFSFCLVLFIGFSYYVTSRFIAKQQYDERSLQKTARYRQALIDEHLALPISIQTEDNVELDALLILRPQAHYTLLMNHGWWMHKEKIRALVDLFSDANILLFDFRAHGQSKGGFTTLGHHEQKDIQAAFEYLQCHDETKDLPVFGLGLSMGAAALVGAARTLPFKGLIIDSMFGRLDEVIGHTFTYQTGLPNFPFFYLCKWWYRYFCNCSMHEINPKQWAQEIDMPVLMIHCYEDHLVEPSVAQQIFASLKTNIKKLWLVEKSRHAKIFKHYPLEYKEKTKEFINAILLPDHPE